MEKLQTALDKARKAREGQDPDTDSITASVKTPQRTTDVDDLWAELTPFDVSAEQLEGRRVHTQVAGAKATSYDILRTKVLLQMRQQGWKRIAITSPMPSSGKTTTACNLALGLGRQSDLRSIVLDLDLRDPSISKFFDVTPPSGIDDVLTGKVDFKDQAMRFGDNVAFSMATIPDADPTRLLLAEETGEVLDNIENRYQPDIMIFDLPSMLVNDDTRAFLKNVDCALIVVRASKTRYGQFDACEKEIAQQTNVLGTVLNAYRYAEPGKMGE
ncbi:CpsD/CapB family tyrosine-protein kinase [Octadecabacter sp. 1_MG-2023]|uniref:CpsD/CapB family tyrosine-protein kinase n=1 Tax=unclassified Octadecabacter TaxID=196158 RepID=UPI001C08ACF8|nr:MULTISPECIES: CpsD/CapB family tyrosine-protein kinase [unclassified Octadecabacter]MBU2993994.1 CpsD/CapB family tyrosine-protein kinase [Octadecabacter sp. B2R22]MDO6736063.1 CpsD/CapB family tyrosine-protein kinase [Octadecabacter sp. 1_MG-2023]